MRHIFLALLISAWSPVFCVSTSVGNEHTDTLAGGALNAIDSQGMRQGFWRITGEMVHDKAYKKGQVVEEGNYLDNKRSGVWKKFFPTGGMRSEITYADNHPRGWYTTYYDNGQIEEIGDWQGNRNVGEYKRFHKNGQVAQHFQFNNYGKRDGVQKYYYPNGQLQMSVEVENGTAHGMMRVFYPNGEPKLEKRIVNGLTDTESIVDHSRPNKAKDTPKIPELPQEETTPPEMDRPNLGKFRDTGFNTLYNRNQQITQVGEFKEGRLWNGKWHRYDADGLLRKVEVYREGRFVGYGVIDDPGK